MAIIRLVVRAGYESNPAAFRVTLDRRDFHLDDIEASLPPVPPKLQAALESWKAAYSDQDDVRSHCRIMGGTTTTRSVREIIELSQSLRTQFNHWLRSAEWQQIREALIVLPNRDEARLMIDLGQDTDLKRLPWQDWDLLAEHYPYSDIALRAFSESGMTVLPYPYPKTAKVRILVIVGESTGIQTAADLQVLQNLQHSEPAKVEVIPLVRPSTAALQAALNDPQGYHILVYIGHSKSSANGQIGWLLLDETSELSIADFERALKKIVQKGLQLAIFNSCDGLGLAHQLARLGTPRCIVMKEPVPDPVAVEFIERLFHQFVQEQQPLLRSVRLARQDLEHFNSNYSEVTWLPTVCMKQNTPPLTWQNLLDHLTPAVSEKTTGNNTVNLSGNTNQVASRDSRVNNRGRAGEPQRSKLLIAAGVIAAVGVTTLLLKQIIPFSKSDPVPLATATSQPAAQMIGSGGTEIAQAAGLPTLSGNYATLKQAGIEAFAKSDYQTAQAKFAEIRRQAKAERQQFGANPDSAYEKALKDPTVLIYQNNAEVRLRHQQGGPLYRIAAAVPLNLNIGQQMLFGIAQAQDNAVNPVSSEPLNLEIVIANDLNNPAQAEAVAAALVKDQSDQQPILAVVGHYTSDSTCKALTQYVPAQLPVVSPLSTLAGLRQDCGNSQLFFRTTSSTTVEAKTLISYLTQQQNRPKVAIFFNPTDSFSRSLATKFEAALKANDGTVVGQAVDLSRPIDVEATLAQLADADALAVFPDGRAGNDGAFKQAVEVIKANRGKKLVLGSNPLYDSSVIQAGGPLTNLHQRLVVATDWHQQCAPTGEGSFVKEAETTWLGQVNRSTALSYEAVQALESTLSPGVDSAQIQQKLVKLSAVKSAVFTDKEISFDDSGDRQELTTRILTTPSNNPKNLAFEPLPGTSCP